MIKLIEKYPILSLLLFVVVMLGFTIDAIPVTIMEARNFISAREMHFPSLRWFCIYMTQNNSSIFVASPSFHRKLFQCLRRFLLQNVNLARISQVSFIELLIISYLPAGLHQSQALCWQHCPRSVRTRHSCLHLVGGFPEWPSDFPWQRSRVFSRLTC